MHRLAWLVVLAGGLAVVPAAGEELKIDMRSKATPFPHYWEQVFGSGRAVLSLRESYRKDLDAVKAVTGLKYVRFHAIFHDENGVYSEDAQGRAVYNFNQVDLIYDGLLERGVKPYVELSFMPRKMAAAPVEHAFWYKQVVAPAKEAARWESLIEAFARHLVERYGEDEVASWYFEVWNEPNIDFWAGEPKWETYCDLYRHTALPLKRVSGRLRVGGPATAQAAWTGRFIDYCAKEKLPLDFVSTHVYANDTPENAGVSGPEDRETLLARAVEKVYREVKASAKPETPIHWSEFNASYMNELEVTDAPFMGPWMAGTIARCDGKTELMSYWTFSDVFEEQGIFKTPFYGGFGLLANHSIPKAAFHVFELLHKLGEERIAVDSKSALVTKTKGGGLAVALWNYAAPGAKGVGKTFEIEVSGLKAGRARVWRVDEEHGNVLKAWVAMGRPASPTKAQVVELRKAGAMAPAESVAVKAGRMKVEVPAHGLVLVEMGGK